MNRAARIRVAALLYLDYLIDTGATIEGIRQSFRAGSFDYIGCAADMIAAHNAPRSLTVAELVDALEAALTFLS